MSYRTLHKVIGVFAAFTIGVFIPTASANAADKITNKTQAEKRALNEEVRKTFEKGDACSKQSYQSNRYIVCKANARRADVRLFLEGNDGAVLSHFGKVENLLEETGEALVFAMNAGMYNDERAPIGLYVEGGVELSPLNTNPGPGNFHLLPNGVFFVDDDGANVLASEAYKKKGISPAFATQSGPMLVIDGAMHPKFQKNSTSRKRRNGVGLNEDGGLYFVLSDSAVTFYDFAAFFRDELNSSNALYLDGTISRIYAPELGRNDPGAAMGPIVGVVVGDRG